nr:Ig-like domain-containing protein [Ruminococcus sp. AM36-18]
MKKSKFTLVIVLGLVLCLLCGTTATFSWFNRPEVLKGDSLSWHGDYNVTNGNNITAVTYAASKTDGSEYSAFPFDFKTPTTVPAHGTKYFCTEVKNTENTPQSISLFLNNSDTNTLSVGVNSPLRTYKRFTSDSQTTSYVTKTPSNVNEKNLYIATNVTDPTIYTMHTWKNGTDSISDTDLNGYIEGKSVNYDNVDYKISYVTIPMEHDCAKLWIRDPKKWFGYDLEITDQNNTYVFKADNKSTAMKQSSQSAGISSFYSKAEAVVGEKFDLSAKAQGTVTYTSSNPNVATVTNDGKVTANKAGTTTVTVTSTGAYGDKITAKCNLTVSKKPVKSSYIPIVTNMKIEGKGTADSDPVVTKVYWYIKNDTQNDAVYSLGDMQISL